MVTTAYTSPAKRIGNAMVSCCSSQTDALAR